MTMQTRSRSSHSPTSDNNVPANNGPKHVCARWDIGKEVELIRFLSGKQGEMSARSFKKLIFKLAANAVRPFYKSDAYKDFASCKLKWTNVCISFIHALPVS
jgi:hypothetical protein